MADHDDSSDELYEDGYSDSNDTSNAFVLEDNHFDSDSVSNFNFDSSGDEDYGYAKYQEKFHQKEDSEQKGGQVRKKRRVDTSEP